MRCVNADAEAIVIFQYPTSQGVQRVPFCAACARQWSSMYGHTAAGEGLTIIPIQGTAQR
jgi:hypothetical protein